MYPIFNVMDFMSCIYLLLFTLFICPFDNAMDFTFNVMYISVVIYQITLYIYVLIIAQVKLFIWTNENAFMVAQPCE